MLDDIALFVHVAQAKSLAGAGAVLDLPAATVTRRLKRLEERLGLQLMHRSARKFALTAEGEAYYRAFAELVQQAELTARNLSSDLHQLSGPLVVAAPTNISVGPIQPMWSNFMRAYPGIRLDLRLSNFNIDLWEQRIDLALRIGPQNDERLFQKKIGTISTLLMAAPSYLERRGQPSTPDELDQHDIIAIRTIPSWRLSHLLSGAAAELHLAGDVIVDDISLVRQFAEDGFGICLLGVTEAAKSLKAGRLVPVMPDWRGQQRDIYAVWPTGRLLNARAKCLRDFMQQHLLEQPIFQGEIPEAE
ncbi:LysR family transcriptional regulator [Roseibium sp.]|uniref:LysR family transcriptional regulator n=1 Tax=Roseibium sp. TaxID=1936156 RepID=UPI003B51FD21